jgi:RsmE family RNA methyltransferase
VLRVLRRQPGDSFEVGLVNAATGLATLEAITAEALQLRFTWRSDLPPAPTTRLVVALPRPQTARDILRDATTLGVASIDFVATARSDPNYAQSRLWADGAWRRHLLSGAAQACNPQIPTITWSHSLDDLLASLPPTCRRLALDLYEIEGQLADLPADPSRPATAVIIGPERGWDNIDRATLRRHGCRLLGLGPRVLRTETAVVASITVVNALHHSREKTPPSAAAPRARAV